MVCPLPVAIGEYRNNLLTPRKNQNHIFSETGDLRFHLRFRAVTDPDHGDHCPDADDNTERSQHRTHFVSTQRAQGNVKCGRDSHGFRESLHGYIGKSVSGAC